MVLATPATVYCEAINESPTPITGPVNTANMIKNIPFRSVLLCLKSESFPFTISKAEKQSNPATKRMIFAENGISSENLAK